MLSACCFTGHRHIPAEKTERLKLNLESVIKILLSAGITHYYAGGALGFDTLAAETVLNFKKQGVNISLTLILPCKNQTKYWHSDDIKRYNKIKELADEVVFVSENYTNSCMHIRNRALVDKSNICICYLEKCSSGTAYTVNYAKSKNRKIINLAHF